MITNYLFHLKLLNYRDYDLHRMQKDLRILDYLDLKLQEQVYVCTTFSIFENIIWFKTSRVC